MTKICSVCKEELSVDNFYASKKTTDGLRNKCKECFNRLSTEYRKSKAGIVTQTWKNQRVYSTERGHPLPDYTKKELAAWMFSQDNFNTLYDAWVKSEYDRLLAVSCDRLDSRLPYSFDNLRLVSFKENHLAENEEMKKGLIGRAIPVQGKHVKTGEVINFISVSDAQRRIGIYQSSITDCARGKIKTTGGYNWKYL